MAFVQTFSRTMTTADSAVHSGTLPRDCDSSMIQVSLNRRSTSINSGGCGPNCTGNTGTGVGFCSNGTCKIQCLSGYTLQGTTCVAVSTTTIPAPSSSMLASSAPSVAPTTAAAPSPVEATSPASVQQSVATTSAGAGANNVGGGGGTQNNDPPLIPIIASAVGGVVALVAVIAASIWAYRRRARNAQQFDDGTDMSDRLPRSQGSKKGSLAKPAPAYTGGGSNPPGQNDGFSPVIPGFKQLPPSLEYPYQNLLAPVPFRSPEDGTPQSAVMKNQGSLPNAALAALSGQKDEKLDQSEIKYPNIVLAAIAGYRATNPDEISIREGDEVFVKEMYPDGWALGSNVTTGNQTGFFPMAALDPSRLHEKLRSVPPSSPISRKGSVRSRASAELEHPHSPTMDSRSYYSTMSQIPLLPRGTSTDGQYNVGPPRMADIEPAPRSPQIDTREKRKSREGDRPKQRPDSRPESRSEKRKSRTDVRPESRSGSRPRSGIGAGAGDRMSVVDRLAAQNAVVDALKTPVTQTPTATEFRGRPLLDSTNLVSPSGSATLSAISPAYLALGGDPSSEDGVAINSTLTATVTHEPSNQDEMALVAGDEAYVSRVFPDGWCYAKNLRTNATGFVPFTYFDRSAILLQGQ
ncbi:hypothetical protein M427DRAFT_467830 [Gonapodya prolifera JEL478]|uniref:SH3 domain-containing protein n=1 Tax=Gonapodya prolifera (strain JEL478) TaxID=1344416 RepID=A0A139A1X3_GONPJ|nr:hypothetical protein M427DRAFT_467830 [Gonapodya prolifera JEL478]|eukprot:KXS10638.1 hypothetical protein M427DRAFT_467830 [Gonapodya prolifera JEL478]